MPDTNMNPMPAAAKAPVKKSSNNYLVPVFVTLFAVVAFLAVIWLAIR